MTYVNVVISQSMGKPISQYSGFIGISVIKCAA